MATIKSYTDLEQSKKLAEKLPLESADMLYWAGEYITHPYMEGQHKDEQIPIWSLAALFSVLPKGTNISTPKPINELGYCCWNQYDEIYTDNSVDACYEMIIRLHELNFL